MINKNGKPGSHWQHCLIRCHIEVVEADSFPPICVARFSTISGQKVEVFAKEPYFTFDDEGNGQIEAMAFVDETFDKSSAMQVSWYNFDPGYQLLINGIEADFQNIRISIDKAFVVL